MDRQSVLKPAEQRTGQRGIGEGNTADTFISWWELFQTRHFFSELRDDEFMEFFSEKKKKMLLSATPNYYKI